MPDIDPFGEAAKYFGKKKVGRDPTVEKMEEAVGIEKTIPLPTPPPVIKLEPEKRLRDRSTGGSPPFTDAEIKRGYRKI